MGAEADGLLAGALERTLAAGTARLTLTRHYDLTASVPVLRRQGGIVGAEAAAEPEHAGGERLRGHTAHADLALVSAAAPYDCLLYTSPSPRDPKTSRMPSSA